MGNRLVAEALGTFWIIFAGCGSALLSAAISIPPSRSRSC
jgi:glycerol uptake facilitator-like aquaporin